MKVNVDTIDIFIEAAKKREKLEEELRRIEDKKNEPIRKKLKEMGWKAEVGLEVELPPITGIIDYGDEIDLISPIEDYSSEYLIRMKNKIKNG